MSEKRENEQMRIDWQELVAGGSSNFLLRMVGMKKVEIDWREIVADSWDFQLMIGGSSNLQQKTAGRVVVEVR